MKFPVTEWTQPICGGGGRDDDDFVYEYICCCTGAPNVVPYF
jgi:hypothetical protein